MFILSLISLLVSIAGAASYVALFSYPGLKTLFIVLSIASLVLPLISKISRISYEKKGKTLEIIAIVIGAFNFYFLIFAFTTFPIFIGYLGGIVAGLIYKAIK